jgi:hypothetical protein
MAAFPGRRLSLTAALLMANCLFVAARTRGTEILFDLPDAIECRDVTPPDFAAAHPALKVVEGKLRISARVAAGAEQDVVDFLYTIENRQRSMRFQDYLPNTTLESAVAGDQMEICDATENAAATGADVRVAYKLFSLGANHSQSAKKSESSRYKQIAAKELVLASGTTNREHGVFFRLRPSRAASLEGAKEFAFLATVPKTWRGDTCLIACSARANSSSFFSSAVETSGNSTALVGVCLVGDAEAAALCRELRLAQEGHAAALAAHAAATSGCSALASQAVGLLTSKKRESPTAMQLEEAATGLSEIEQRLTALSQ